MKINDILDKVTLKFAGGGKLKLRDYAPYISNENETIEGLSEGGPNPIEDCPSPVAYLCLNAYKDENAMNLEYLGISLPNLYEPKIFTKEELKEYIESLKYVAGNDLPSFDDNYSINSPFTFMPLYQSSDIKDQCLNIVINFAEDGWHYCFLNNYTLITEELLINLSAPQNMIDVFNNVLSLGYFGYLWSTDEQEVEPTADIDNIDTYREDYAVKVYFDSQFTLYIQDDNGNDLMNVSSGNGNYFTDDNGDYVLCPLGTYNIFFNDNTIELNDGDETVSGTSPFEYTFSKDKEYSITTAEPQQI